MLPIRDNVAPSRASWASWVLIGANTVAFVVWGRAEELTQHGLVPRYLWSVDYWQRVGLIPVLSSLLTFMFLHAGVVHLAGNMVFLWIFGRGVEAKLGAKRFVALYLISGVVSGIGHALFQMRSDIPLVGASGAVAGVLGAYFVLYPRAWILAFLPPLLPITVWVVLLSYLLGFRPPTWALGLVWVPAVFFLLLWFAFQVFNGWQTLTGDLPTQVGWWAHVFGFIAGYWIVTRCEGRWRR